MLKKIILGLFLIVAMLPVGTQVQAIALDDGLTHAGADAGFNTTRGLPETIGLVIKAVVGFSGVIFLVLTLYAGFTWMTAAGDEKKVTKAKGTLATAVIGLVICLSAYTITSYIVGRVQYTQTGTVAPSG